MGYILDFQMRVILLHQSKDKKGNKGKATIHQNQQIIPLLSQMVRMEYIVQDAAQEWLEEMGNMDHSMDVATILIVEGQET